MKEKKVTNVSFDMQIRPFDFEKMLFFYGMTKKEYCELRNKSKSWFYSVLRRRRYLTRQDILSFVDNIGVDEFLLLLNKVGIKYDTGEVVEELDGK